MFKKVDKQQEISANDLLIDFFQLAKKYDILSMNKEYVRLYTDVFGETLSSENTPANIQQVTEKLQTMIRENSKDERVIKFIDSVTLMLEERKIPEYFTELRSKKVAFFKKRKGYLATKLMIADKVLKNENPLYSGVREIIACTTMLKAMNAMEGKPLDIVFENMSGDVIATSIKLNPDTAFIKRGPASFLDSFFIIEVEDPRNKGKKFEVPLNLIIELDNKILCRLEEFAP